MKKQIPVLLAVAVLLLSLALSACGSFSVPKATFTLRHNEIQELIDEQACASKKELASSVIVDASDCVDGNAQLWTANIGGKCSCFWLDAKSKVATKAMDCSDGAQLSFESAFFSISCDVVAEGKAPIFVLTRLVDLTVDTVSASTETPIPTPISLPTFP